MTLSLDPAPEHQQGRRPRARVTMPVTDRQLLQRYLLGPAQFYDTPHPLPRRQEGAGLGKFKRICQAT
jgi:hypothetical protein